MDFRSYVQDNSLDTATMLYIISFRVLESNKNGSPTEQKIVVISISPQSLASIAAKYELSMNQAMMKMTTFFKSIGCSYVFDTNFARSFSLIQIAKEFVER